MTFTEEAVMEKAPAAAVEPVGVLVVDSDEGVRWSLERGLSHTGYRVEAISTAEDAVARVQENGIAAVVMEVTPEAGLTVDVLSKLVSAHRTAVIVCSSVDTSPHVVMECVRRGAAGFL